MGRYAEATQVPSNRSRAEIEKTLQRYGATAFAYGWQGNEAQVMFEMADRRIRFALPMPDRADKEFTRAETGRDRSPAAAEKAYEQAVRQTGQMASAKPFPTAVSAPTIEGEARTSDLAGSEGVPDGQARADDRDGDPPQGADRGPERHRPDQDLRRHAPALHLPGLPVPRPRHRAAPVQAHPGPVRGPARLADPGQRPQALTTPDRIGPPRMLLSRGADSRPERTRMTPTENTTPTQPPAPPTGDAVHTYFGLSYASYKVLDRTLLQSMPDGWQTRFVAVMKELDDAYDHLDLPDYKVETGRFEYPGDCDERELAAAGVTANEEEDGSVTYYGPDGHEIMGAEVFVREPDPIPPYGRGRAYVPPTLPEPAAHLWEVKHPFYCHPHNRHVPLNQDNGQNMVHDSWAAFLDFMGPDDDPERNLVFRWDWTRDLEDEEEPSNELDLFMVLQGRGDYWCHTVVMDDRDEGAVRDWLTARLPHLLALWVPLPEGKPADE